MGIERTIANLPNLNDKSLEVTSANAATRARSGSDKDAALLRDAADREYVNRSETREGWIKNPHGAPRLLMNDGRVIGAVRRLNTHKADRKEVWIGEIMGQEIDGIWHHVEEARAAVETEIERRGAA